MLLKLKNTIIYYNYETAEIYLLSFSVLKILGCSEERRVEQSLQKEIKNRIRIIKYDEGRRIFRIWLLKRLLVPLLR